MGLARKPLSRFFEWNRGECSRTRASRNPGDLETSSRPDDSCLQSVFPRVSSRTRPAVEQNFRTGSSLLLEQRHRGVGGGTEASAHLRADQEYQWPPVKVAHPRPRQLLSWTYLRFTGYHWPSQVPRSFRSASAWSRLRPVQRCGRPETPVRRRSVRYLLGDDSGRRRSLSGQPGVFAAGTKVDREQRR